MNPPHPSYPPSLGATYLGDRRCRFLVWGPKVRTLELRLLGPAERILEMNRRDGGYFELTVDGVEPGTEYFYRIDGDRDRPDPASRYQPGGVHAPSAVVDSRFEWTDGYWHGISLHKYLTYELHVGTFTPEGTFDAAIDYLDDLRELGVTAIELMPVAQFPGGRNWGYDGVHPFAVQNTYGGPAGLKRLVDAAHARGLAVVMDVVYNHVGPEGNYLPEFGHYFTGHHHTTWGAAINFDDRYSDEVRRFFIENALYWIDEFHIDTLRLDAVHAILDFSARPFLQELADAVRVEGERLNRLVYTIAESGLNDARLISSKEAGGIGIDGQWCDDLHHALRTELMADRSGFFVDFRGFDDVVKAYRDGFVLNGGYSIFRGRRHGNSARDVDPVKLVVCAQNHDQIGNRQFGERLTELVSFEQLKLAAAVILLSPYQPMLFMGEEYAETARFQYFVSHLDKGLIEAVRSGRKAEFTEFNWKDEPPDPQDEATFLRCKLNHALKKSGKHRIMREFYQQLIKLRTSEPSLAYPEREKMEIAVPSSSRAMTVRRWSAGREIFCAFHFGAENASVDVRLTPGKWQLVLNSADSRWNGPGDPLPRQIESTGQTTLPLPRHSMCIYVKRTGIK
ncbi:MAG: malto-oligosyltrehalose trehalohydrolase [Planctomycetaceae bacterium]